MDNVKKLHSGTLYRSNGQIGGDYQLSQHSPAGRSDADTEEAELRHIINMQANEYGVGVDPDYGMYVSSSGGQYNHMGHLTMAPSQKYPHVMSDSMSVGGVVTSAPYHPVPSQPHYPPYYGNQYGGYMGEPQPQYLTQDYGERTHSPGSASSRSASPGGHPQPQPRTVPSPGPPSHPLSCVPSRYDDPSMGHYCQDGMQTAGPGYGYSSGPGYGVSMGHPGGHPSHPPSFKDSQNGLSVGGHSVYGDEDDIAKQMQGMSLAMHCGVLSPSGGPIGLVGQPPDERGALTWRDPNLPEVIGFLNSPSDVVKANAAAYLQHLTFMDDTNKQKTRVLGGIPPLVRLVSSESAEVCRNACGALRNLSYGRQNDENKRTIRDAGGITSLMSLVCRTNDTEVKELITGIIWNMSSCEDLKQSIIDDAAHVIVAQVIIPHSGWHPTSPGDTYWSQVFRNASGVLRNASSAGEYARRRLRCLPGLSESLLHAVRAALAANAITTKIVENCVCVLRNLSYRCQEVEDPLYDSRAPPTSTTSGQPRIQAGASKGENLGCFGGSKKKKEANNASSNSTSPHGGKAGSSEGSLGAPEGSLDGGVGTAPQGGYTVPKGTEMLWSPEVVPLYLALLQSCSNPETLEAAAGALQNLAACYWQPSIDIRAAVRKEKGLPILVELLRMEVDRVVCAVATALRNLAIDQRNKELIGKYAMRDLVQKLPGGNVQHDQGTSDDTIAAVLATLNEVIKKSAEFSRSLLEAGGVDRLIAITKNRQKYTPRVLKFAGAVLATMWSHAELREVYRKHGWREPDFTSAARIVTSSNSNSNTVNRSNVSANRGQASSQGSLASSGPHSPNNANSTLSRPMASQGGTRYEDRTIRRGRPGDEIPMVDINNYQEGGNSNGRPLNQMQQPSR